ncbi:putative translocation in type III secretion domain protein, partial [Vibrio parahaemolyticus V-223/04]
SKIMMILKPNLRLLKQQSYTIRHSRRKILGTFLLRERSQTQLKRYPTL